MSDPEESDRIIQLEEALQRIKQWANAYPVTVFKPIPPEKMELASKVLADNGIDMGALHASWARHILTGIAQLCEEGLKNG